MTREIIVKGHGEARSIPDRAIVHVIVDAEGSSRDDAYRDAAESTNQVDRVIENRREAIARVTAAALVVHPKTRWRKGESVRTGWRASRSSVLEVTGFEQLGELIAELAAAGAATSGPSWQLDPGNAAHREARRLAAEDARRRADDYAEALGLIVEEVVWISEPGLRLSQGFDQPVRAFAAAAAPRGALAGEEVVDVSPEEIATFAAVEVGFQLTSRAEREAT